MSVIVLYTSSRIQRDVTLRIIVVYWVLAAIFLIIALAIPRLRPIGIVGCVVLGLMLGWGMLQRLRGAGPEEERGRPSAPTSAVATFPIAALQTQELRLAGNGAPFELRGQLTNIPMIFACAPSPLRSRAAIASKVHWTQAGASCSGRVASGSNWR